MIERFGAELVSVFLFPPSWEELERRLRARGTDADEVIRTRLANARWEVGFADRYGYWVVNDDLRGSVARMRAIITAEGCRRERLAASCRWAESDSEGWPTLKSRASGCVTVDFRISLSGCPTHPLASVLDA